MNARLARLTHPIAHARPSRPELRLVAPVPAVAQAPEARARAAGGPQDEARYSCGCGFAFRAQVSTSVACPHCGGAQAW